MRAHREQETERALARAHASATRAERSGGGASTGALITDEREAVEETEPEVAAVEPQGAPVEGAEPETPVADATGETEAEERTVPQKGVQAEDTPAEGPRTKGEG